jgi:hypothetical protein
MAESDNESNAPDPRRTVQLPAIVRPAAVTSSLPAHLLPALIAAAGDAAGWRYIEFFTANIRNPNTRRAYPLHVFGVERRTF